MTSFQYDALGRIIRTVYPDGNDSECEYAGRISKAYDTTGRWRQFQYDPLGNLISVNDNGLYTTNYQYSVLGNLVGVTQGDRTRTFVYDSPNRLTSGSNPESGTATYSYDSCSNMLGKTDANSVHTTFSYDTLSRVVSTAYTDATPAISYYYDGENPLSISCQNPKGRLTGINMPRIKEAFSYDKMSRLIKEVKEIDGQRFEISYIYDLAGNLVTEVYPSGRVVSVQINPAGRINYYDSSGGNNGDVIGIMDNLHADKSAAYAYDALSRLISASSATWSQAFTYDVYGNMLAKQGTGGAPSATFTYSQKNQIVGLTYDENGNLTSDGRISLIYDANNQIKATGIYAYLYDSDGNRVIKEENSAPIETNYYIYDLSGMPIAEYTKVGSGSICCKKDLIYLGTVLVQSDENPNPQTLNLPPVDLVQSPSRDSTDVSPWRNSEFPASGTGAPTPAKGRSHGRVRGASVLPP